MEKELITKSTDNRIQLIKVHGNKIECFQLDSAGIVIKKIGEMTIIEERDIPLNNDIECLELLPDMPKKKLYRFETSFKNKCINQFYKLERKHPTWTNLRIATFIKMKLIRKKKQHIPGVSTILYWVNNY